MSDEIVFGSIAFEHVFRHFADVIRLNFPLKSFLQSHHRLLTGTADGFFCFRRGWQYRHVKTNSAYFGVISRSGTA